MYDPTIWTVLDLNENQQKVILAIEKVPKSESVISRHSGLPRTTVSYILKHLQKRLLVKPFPDRKRIRWKSDIPHVIRSVRLYSPK